jgi:hypothetical protein
MAENKFSLRVGNLQSRPTAVPAIKLGLLLVRTNPMAPPAAVSAARTYEGNSRPCAVLITREHQRYIQGCLYHFELQLRF